MIKFSADNVFMIAILTINSIVWVGLSVPRYRQRLPTIYLIARSWLIMLTILFSCYWLSRYQSDSSGLRPYWWALPVLFMVIGVRGGYEMHRLWRTKSKVKFIKKLAIRSRSSQTPHQADAKHPTTYSPKHNPSSSTSSPLVTSYNGQPNTSSNGQLNTSYAFTLLDIGFLIVFFMLILSLIVLSQLAISRQQQGVFLFVIFASQFNDIAQYLCGRSLGGKFFKRKLAPTISPNKTIEGAFFGSIVSACLATLLGIWLTPFTIGWCFVAAYFLAVSGIVGDLFESAFKRSHAIKDTGTMLAGHGGILDRVDSLLIGVPFFTVVYWILG